MKVNLLYAIQHKVTIDMPVEDYLDLKQDYKFKDYFPKDACYRCIELPHESKKELEDYINSF